MVGWGFFRLFVFFEKTAVAQVTYPQRYLVLFLKLLKSEFFF